MLMLQYHFQHNSNAVHYLASNIYASAKEHSLDTLQD